MRRLEEWWGEGGRRGVSADRPVKGETRSEMSNQSEVWPNDGVSADLAEPTSEGGGGRGGQGEWGR